MQTKKEIYLQLDKAVLLALAAIESGDQVSLDLAEAKIFECQIKLEGK